MRRSIIHDKEIVLVLLRIPDIVERRLYGLATSNLIVGHWLPWFYRPIVFQANFGINSNNRLLTEVCEMASIYIWPFKFILLSFFIALNASY